MTGIVQAVLTQVQAMRRARLAMESQPDSVTIHSFGGTQSIEENRGILKGLSDEVLDSSALLWVAEEMVHLVKHAAPSLPDYEFNPGQLPWRDGIVVMGVPIGESEMGASINALQWRMVDDSTCVVALLGPLAGGLGPVSWQVFYAGKTTALGGALGADATVQTHLSLDGGRIELVRFCHALWRMVQQRIAVQRVVPADRAERRRWERENARPLPEVTVIELRRPISRPSEGSSVMPVEWSHRWIVDGHWRNQYHPSTGTHVPTWIAPHVKGPDDKPLIVKQKVHAWVR